MFSMLQMIITSVFCGAIAAAVHWYVCKREARYKQEIRSLLFMLEHRNETYDATIIEKRETDKGYMLIKIRFFDKNSTEVIKELKMPSHMYDIKIGDTIKIHQISESEQRRNKTKP